MPNKTIYVAERDVDLFQRAQELAGGNLSAAISKALQRYVEVEEGKDEGLQEITVRVGPGKGRRQRFLGVQLVDWTRSTKNRSEHYRVFRSRAGKYVIHLERSAEYVAAAGPDGNLTGWRRHLSADQSWGTTAATAILEVLDDLDTLREKSPAPLYDLVLAAVDQPVIEDLDI